MSLFQSFGQGDFWGKGFAFASPVNDLLDRGDFTLTELLDEDDLLQEIKSLNTRLIDFLAQESTLEEMVTYLVEPAPEGADDKRVHKYPYMACEVICCEVDHLLDVLVAMQDGATVARLFSLLDTEGELDDRLSGYFEKIVFVLLKRKCLQLMAYINAGGLPLFQKFVRHLSNYSVMQVVERLFLHQPGWEGGCYATGGPIGLDLGGGDEDGSGGSGGPHGEPDLSLLRCQWSTMPEVVDLLVEQLSEESAGEGEGEVVAVQHTQVHVAELLLTVIENASADSAFVKHLTERMGRLAELAVPALDLGKGQEAVEAEALAVVREERPSMLSALTIVEALLSRPQAIKMQWDMGQQQHVVLAQGGGQQVPLLQGEQEVEEQDPTQVSLPPDELEEEPGLSPPSSSAPGQEGGEGMGGFGAGAVGMGIPTLGEEVLSKLVASLPLIRVYLQTHERDDRQVATQMRKPAPKLGLTRLKLVRHVEALVKLCSPKVDRPLETEGVLRVCLDMFFKYQWTSVLHQSITRIVTWIMDAGPSRLGLQVYLVKECGILERILAANAYNDEEEQVARVPTAAAGVAPEVVDQAGPVDEEKQGGSVRCRRGYMGHLFIMAQAVMEAARQLPGPGGGEMVVAGEEQPAQGEGESGVRVVSSPQVSFAREVDPELLSRWAAFIQGRLAQVTATQCQPLGGYPIPSRADENKLSTKFDEDSSSTDFDQMSDMLAQRLQGVDVTGKETASANGAFVGGEPGSMGGLTAEEAVRIAASVPLVGAGGDGLLVGEEEKAAASAAAVHAEGEEGEEEGEGEGFGDIRGSSSSSSSGGGGWAVKQFGVEGAPTTGTFGEASAFRDPVLSLLIQQAGSAMEGQLQGGPPGGEWADFSSAFATAAAASAASAAAAHPDSFRSGEPPPPSASTSSGSLVSSGGTSSGLEFEADFSDLPPMAPPAAPASASEAPLAPAAPGREEAAPASVAAAGEGGVQVPNGGGLVAEYFADREGEGAEGDGKDGDGKDGGAGVLVQEQGEGETGGAAAGGEGQQPQPEA